VALSRFAESGAHQWRPIQGLQEESPPAGRSRTPAIPLTVASHTALSSIAADQRHLTGRRSPLAGQSADFSAGDSAVDPRAFSPGLPPSRRGRVVCTSLEEGTHRRALAEGVRPRTSAAGTCRKASTPEARVSAAVTPTAEATPAGMAVEDTTAEREFVIPRRSGFAPVLHCPRCPSIVPEPRDKPDR